MLDENQAAGDRMAFRWITDLAKPFHDDAKNWIWNGYIRRGGVTLLSGWVNVGRSTLLGHLFASLDGRTTSFLGESVCPSRVLCVSEESVDMWTVRRQEAGIRDNVGLVTREDHPFVYRRPSHIEWREFIKSLCNTVKDHSFDLVVFDTIGKFWPVQDENSVDQVEEALMPLWHITDMNRAVLLVHTNRKPNSKGESAPRGSGGLLAFPETVIELQEVGEMGSENATSETRLLKSYGRYNSQFPIEITLLETTDLDSNRRIYFLQEDIDEADYKRNENKLLRQSKRYK